MGKGEGVALEMMAERREGKEITIAKLGVKTVMITCYRRKPRESR